MAERVGVLMVHGIGEQGHFEHLEAEVRALVSAWEERGARARVQVNTSGDAAYQARQETWRGDTGPPLEVVLEQQGRSTHVEFHEVWWADLDEPTTLGSHLRFWFWSLSLWNTRRYLDPGRKAYDAWMRPPSHWCRTTRGLTFRLRAALFGLGIVLLLSYFTLSLLNFVLDRLFGRRLIPSDILVRYLGDVKLYQQAWRPGRGPLGHLGQPPRVALRQRMVRQMLRMAEARYDRWYILAHSQGTILAFNALMEPAERLPHYLTRGEWQRLQTHLGNDAGPDPAADGDDPGEPGDDEASLFAGLNPPRPDWLAPGDAIDRARVFERLRGFLTYGSPLETFASLWPAIVSLNRNERVFRDDFEWINIVDPSDPVATRIEHFDPQQASQLQPRNLLYRCRWWQWHLVSHISYLSWNPGAPQRLVHAVGAWLRQGAAFASLAPGAPSWPTEARTHWLERGAFVTWFVWALALASVVGPITHALVCGAARRGLGGTTITRALEGMCSTSDGLAAMLPILPVWMAHGLWTLVVVGVVVLACGGIARLPWWRHGRL